MNSWLIAQNAWAVGVPLRMSGRLIRQRLGLNSQHQRREGREGGCTLLYPSTCEVDAGESEAQGPSCLHCDFQANLTV